MDLFKGLKPLDYVLTALMVALAALLGFANVTVDAAGQADLAHPQDSQSVLMIAVFIASALPILIRRRNILAAIAVSFVVMAASVVMFGWVTRCGFALPLSIAMAYAVARFAGGRQNQIVGLVGIVALQVVILVKDSSTGGLDALAVGLPAAALLYGIGLFVESRAGQDERPTVVAERVNA